MTGCVQNLEKCSLKTLFYRFLEKSKQKTFIKYRPAWTEYLTPTEKATPSNVLFPRKSQVRNAARTKRGIVARHFSIFRREFEAVSAASKGEISLMAMKYSGTFRCCQMTCPPGVPLAFKGGFKEICGRFGLQGGTCVCESHSGTRCHSLRVLPVRGKIVRSYDKRERSASGYHARNFFYRQRQTRLKIDESHASANCCDFYFFGTQYTHMTHQTLSYVFMGFSKRSGFSKIHSKSHLKFSFKSYFLFRPNFYRSGFKF